MGALEEVLPLVEGFVIYPFETYVALSWNPVSDGNFQYYHLERSTDPEFAEDVESQYITSNYYEDDGLEYDIEYFYRISYFAGVWSDHSEVLSVTLQWMDVDEGQLPKAYALHQNYPNPFNPVTNLSYDLPEEAMVNITIFDMMGRMVTNLVNENQSAGYKTLQWNAINNSGQPISAGLYIYSIKAGNFSQNRKMILLK